MTTDPVLSVRGLRVSFPGRDGRIEVVRNISFSLGCERLGIVGESGSGKSMTGRAVMRLLPPYARVTADVMQLQGMDLLALPPKEMRKLRGRRMGMILQDPKHALNPVKTVGAAIAEVRRYHHGGSSSEAARAALDLLDKVQIRDPERVYNSYPHQLSGGLGQRVMIAMMLAPEPLLLIADEPTSALDASVQSEILLLIERLVVERGMGLILISHDLPLVSQFCDRIIVMYSGRIVEELGARDLTQAQHPYTRGLLSCLPRLSREQETLPTLARDPLWLREDSL